MWPGFLTQSRLCADGIFLNVDTATKFIQKRSILDQIDFQLHRGFTKERVADEFDSSNLDYKRRTVITSYNIKSYQVDGLDFSISPRTHFFKLKRNNIVREISMLEYLESEYKVRL